MFRVEVASVEEYFNFDPARRAELLAFNGLMATHAPSLECYFHGGAPAGDPGMRFKMIGYGRFQYPASSGALVAWPVVGLALQKNYISVYLSVSKGPAPVLAAYALELNAARSGRNNFSFKRLSDLNRPILEALIAEVAAITIDDPTNAARYRSCRPGREVS